MNIHFDNKACILPNESLGGISLRVDITGMQSYIEPYIHLDLALEKLKHSPEYIDYQYVSDFKVKNLPIKISVDNRNNKIFRITAISGYEGFLFGNVHVGMYVSEACNSNRDFYYDEAEEVILCKQIDGISLAVPIIDPLPEMVAASKIYSITVFAKESNSIKGIDGTW